MMRFPMTVLRVVTLAPALLVSFVLTVVMCALLPPALGLVAFMAAGGVLVALAMGQLQQPAIAALTNSRPATEAEFRVMAPVLAELGAAASTSPRCSYAGRSVQAPRWQWRSGGAPWWSARAWSTRRTAAA
ncbi:hypothetical protein [Nocardioides daphniae]|uniref:Uncharacterized protein n=1 Tax=Nocardioides daphniae TaxID=402297 RepID=A0A4P7U7W9_9ACTN|nr:hypothetical protein [Nocardioides daphniae]QCC76086.1 hypothetical protein E2C04_00725 [Nocardioides daphniae]